MHNVSNESRQRLQPINSRGTKAHRAGVRVILPNRWHLSDLEAESCGLDQYLSVEDKIVAVLEERNRLEEPTRVRAIPGVVFGEVQAEDAILRRSQEAVAEPLPPRHARLRGVQPKPARPQHDVGLAGLDHAAE